MQCGAGFGPTTLATTMQQSLGAFTVNLFVLFCFDFFSPHFLFLFSCLHVFCYLKKI